MSWPVVTRCISIAGHPILQGTDNRFKSIGASPEKTTFLSIKIFLRVTQSSSSLPTSCSAWATVKGGRYGTNSRVLHPPCLTLTPCVCCPKQAYRRSGLRYLNPTHEPGLTELYPALMKTLTKHSAASSMNPSWKRCSSLKLSARACLMLSDGRAFSRLCWNWEKMA